MSTAAKRWRFVLGYVRLNLSIAMAYRGSFLLQMCFMAINDLFILFFWWVLFSRLTGVAGWDFRGVATLCACSATAFGIGAAFCSNFLGLSRLIAEGQLDYYLAAPQDPFLHVLVAKGWFAGFGDILFGLGCFLIAQGFDWRLPFFLLLCLAGAAVTVAAGFIYHGLSFFWGRNEALSEQIQGALITFSLWPGEIFPPAMRFLFFTLIPAGFVSYLPVRLLTHFSWPLLAILLLAAAAMVYLARAFFNLGLKRYESGNLMVMRD